MDDGSRGIIEELTIDERDVKEWLKQNPYTNGTNKAKVFEL